MGNSSSTEINTELLLEKVEKVRSSLTDRDRRLFNHAKFAIVEEEEKCDDCELFIDFEDQVGITLQTNRNPSGRIVVGYDGNDRPKYAWERRGFRRDTKKYFIKRFSALMGVVPYVAPTIAVACVLRSIQYR